MVNVPSRTCLFGCFTRHSQTKARGVLKASDLDGSGHRTCSEVDFDFVHKEQQGFGISLVFIGVRMDCTSYREING